MSLTLAILLSLSMLMYRDADASACTPENIGRPDLYGASILDVQAGEVHNYTSVSLGPGTNEGGRYTVDFCNVTITHTHPGWDDSISTQIWLPLKGWNGRFQAVGGGGYSVGFGSTYLTFAVANGFASASTDGGIATGSEAVPTDLSWALSSNSNLNWFLFENYATKATHDMALIGKQITESYYGRPATYSYFAGCSGGGRQGMMMAQQYPDVFDGILAIAPAINLETFIPAGFWPEQVMNAQGYLPASCEVDAFTAAAVQACDNMDGVEDGIISSPELCELEARSFVGQTYTCNGTNHTLSAAGARAVDAAWEGSGQKGWYGLNKDAAISSYYIPTTCTSNATCSYSAESALVQNWLRYMVFKDADYDLSTMDEETFFDALHTSTFLYSPMVANVDPDLSKFRANGGKLISWHGLADEAIPPQGSIKYYEDVLQVDPNAQDFFRFFEAPGVGHCYGGVGPIPNGALGQLMDWVENKTAPSSLHATKGSVNNTARDLCPYPLKQVYTGGDSSMPSSFTCLDKA